MAVEAHGALCHIKSAPPASCVGVRVELLKHGSVGFSGALLVDEFVQS